MVQPDEKAVEEVAPEKQTGPGRRTFAPAYKHSILEQIDGATKAEVADILRRENLTSGHIATWRRQRARGQLGGPVNDGPSPDPSRAAPAREALPRPPAQIGGVDVPVQLRPIATSDLREIFGKIRRRKWAVLGTVAGMTLLAVILLWQITPRYTATTTMMIDTRDTNIANMDSVVSGLPHNAEAIRSELEVIRSPSLAEKVIDELRLDENPEFNPDLREAGTLSRWAASLAGFLDDGIANPATGRPNPSQEARRVAIVDIFLERLKATGVGRSLVMEVSFTSQDPRLAASVANTLGELYILEQLEAKFEATKSATAWLNDRVAELREQVEAAETAVEEFRVAHGLIESRGATLVQQQISELSTQLIQANGARVEAETRVRQAKRLAESDGGAESAGEVLRSTLIQTLRARQSDLQREIAELDTELGPLHPRMQQLESERRDLQGAIRAEVNKLIQGLENEASVARAREASLKADLDALELKVAESNRHEVQLRALEREAEASRLLLEAFLSRFTQTSSQQDISVHQPDVRVIARANVPNQPSYPKKAPILVLVVLGSSVLGLLLAFLREQFDPGYRSGEEIERATGVRSLGFVPRLGGALGLARTPSAYVLEHPGSALAEAFRNLSTSVALTRPEAPPRVILLASSMPGEGKTSTAVCLAEIQALAGHKVIVVDSDVRRPGVHRTFGIARSPGLVEVLSDECPLAEAIRRHEHSGADILPAGRQDANPSDLLNSEQMDELLGELSDVYDQVIVDSPPVMAVPDARVLAAKVDASIFLVRWAYTRRETVMLALKQLASSGARLAGVTMSLVDARKHAMYGYPDSGAYYGRLKRYYAKR